MKEFWKDLTVTLLPGIAIALVTAWATVRLSLRQFSLQRLWDKKLLAYEEILAALHNMKRYAEAYIESYGRQQAFKEVEQRLSASRREARATLDRTIDIGELYISRDAIAVLRDLQRKLREAVDERDFHAMATSEVRALDEALGRLLDLSTHEVTKRRS